MSAQKAGQDDANNSDVEDRKTAEAAVLVSSDPIPENTPVIKGPDFNVPQDLQSILYSMSNIGFQATNLGKAIDIINKMRASPNCTIFLGYTSNLISSGLREIIRYLAQHKLISCIVATAGGVEEDYIKCLGKTYLGEFSLSGAKLRERGLNRIGNLLIPNQNYCKFEDWVVPLLEKMLQEQKSENKIWTPSTIIDRLGKEINDEESVYYWCHKNRIPVFCPALTDGSLGDMIYFHSFKSEGLIVDIAADIRKINTMAVRAKNTGMIILGGGIVKHHICNANLMRNGADYAVYINTGQEFDGSDAGASPDEAVSWGKIRVGAESVKVFGDASIIFPLIVGGTWGSGEKIEKR
ncbi:putative deoxyhypusine synthase [Neolecta irregularis DAH-3]|uniref:deoxyhypusine synthase n=1 Tax=Neolecta irregularis (strain DAH-3) TaxID=1198029 RepID=A0A1U7LQF7_NEOID|nr:putative deoxyhypusine synthase [Neolecta irregularis DAH-3]|eukprot:OLL24858.1 putative deoxyhypusine synthase [Neolecta irregularis DAH-3]